MLIRDFGDLSLLIFPKRRYHDDDSIFVINKTMKKIIQSCINGCSSEDIIKQFISQTGDSHDSDIQRDITNALANFKSILSNEKLFGIDLDLRDAEAKLKRVHDQVWGFGLPFYVGIEPAWNCNFRCIHCYLADKKSEHLLHLYDWQQILDDLADCGCLYLAITGGEPLLYPYFDSLYLYAKKRGVVVTVLTNGSLISEQICELFSEYPPKQIDISMYGASQKTWTEVTKNPNGYTSFVRGTKMLAKIKDRSKTLLKAVVIKENEHELFEMEKYASSLSFPLRKSFVIRPQINGAPQNISCRIDAAKAVQYEMELAGDGEEWQRYTNTRRSSPKQTETVECAGGRVAMQIDARGQASYCVQYREPSLSVLDGGVKEVWAKMKQLREVYFQEPGQCRTCLYHAYCDYCPAWNKLEGGDEKRVVSYVCDIARSRYYHLQLRERRECDEC